MRGVVPVTVFLSQGIFNVSVRQSIVVIFFPRARLQRILPDLNNFVVHRLVTTTLFAFLAASLEQRRFSYYS
jgi:hypothetical protein